MVIAEVDLMDKAIRLGIVGLGNIGLQHIKNVLSGEVPRCQLTAVSSRSLHPIAGEIGVPHFCDYRDLIDSGLCDAVLVAAPNLQHSSIGEYVLDKGLHLMMEKPIAMSAFEAELMLEKAGEDTVFGLMLNQRTDPVFVKMKDLISSGKLGSIQRTHWTMTHWFRPEVYYQASEWRATWHADGGGLLLNQCIHNLDILQWLCGMPSCLQGYCGFGKFHDIEVDDEATAFLAYGNGASGVFIGSTGEAPGVNRLDIVGDKGTLSFDGERLIFKQNSLSTKKFGRDTRDMFGMPEVTVTDITPKDKVNQHAAILTNFVDSIIDGVTLIAPGVDGMDSVNLANAIVQSSWDCAPVDFPFDTRRYQKELTERRRGATLREKQDVEVVIDMDKSFR